MKRILTAAAALLLSVATFAQNDGPPPVGAPQGAQQGRPQRIPMTPEQRAKRETDQINNVQPLGDAYQKVLDVYTQKETKRESIMNGARRNDLTEDQRMQLKQLNEDYKKNLQTAMGTDLYEKYKAAEKAKREQMRSSGGGAPPQGGGNGR
jgi:hypothetical protein